MAALKRTYQIAEYGAFVRDADIPGYVSLPSDVFDTLENFVLSNSNRENDALDLMGVSVRKGIGKVITAKNYVGVISIERGVTIEILPKICSCDSVTVENTKKLLIKMLKTLKKAPFKSLQTTDVRVDDMSIFEVFIRMFIDEVYFIVKRGLKCCYESCEANENVFKGKLIISKNIRTNYVHKEHSYVQFDEFNSNRVENRLLKSTLSYLYRCTNSSRNKKDLKLLLCYFTNVELSRNYNSDFDQVVLDRQTMDYETALLWSRVFLQGKSFTSFAGSNIAFALLFPMERLFESYIASLVRKNFVGTRYSVSIQDSRYHLFDKPSHKFQLRPDIVIRNIDTDDIIVMDTKWKLLSSQKTNYGIAQSDMYQMYAYQKKYQATRVILLYPYSSSMEGNDKEISYTSSDGVIVKIHFIDLLKV